MKITDIKAGNILEKKSDSIYYGTYPVGCIDENILPYLSHKEPICKELNMSKESQKKFFKEIRKYATEHYARKKDENFIEPYYHCFIFNEILDLYTFKYVVKGITLPDDFIEGFEMIKTAIIVWVM